MNVQDWLTQARGRADAATDGPWNHHAATRVIDFGEYRGGVTSFAVVHNPDGRAAAEPDASFIAAARTDLPAALDAIQAVLDLVEPLHPDDLVSEVDRAVERQDARVRAAIATALGVSE